LLILGPSTVLYGLTGAAAICFFISYIIPIVCLLFRGRNNLPKERYCNLGRFGPAVNVVSVVWASLVSVCLCFPVYVPVTGSTMNYASAVMVVGLALFILLWLFHARNHYQVPTELYASELHGPGASSEEEISKA
jgi:choline transport protein